MLSYKLANVPVAAEAARTARAMTVKATARERAHVEALDAWIAGDMDRTLAIWDDIVTEHPTDILAFRLAHFNNFWLGRPEAMRASVEQVFPKWGRDMPGYGTILSCRCFANEECGDYAAAEPSGGPPWRSTPPTFGVSTPLLTSWRCRAVSAKASICLKSTSNTLPAATI